jgi:hypothetical protein
MDRRGWLLNLITGLCAGSLSACNTFSLAPDDAAPTALTRWWEPPHERPATVMAAARQQAPASAVLTRPEAPLNKDIERVSEAAQTTNNRYPLPEVISPEQSRQNFPQPRTMPPELTATPEISAKQPLEPPLVSALRCLMDKRPTEAAEYLRGYDKASQDLLLCMLPLMTRLTEGGLKRVDAQEASALVTQLHRLEDVLVPRANLLISKMCFVRKIEKFGVYQAWGDDHLFRPRERMVVYVEVQNFSNMRLENAYEVRLANIVEIRDYRKAPVWIDKRFKPLIDQSQSPRRDCYNWCGFDLPDCPPGMYTLQLKIMDVPTGRTANRSLDFQVGPALSQAGL